MKFLQPPNKAFKRGIWNYHLADFDKYRHVLTNSNLEEKLNQTTDIDQNTKEVTETIIYAADQAIPNKYVTVRPTEHPWITCHIKNLIRKRKRSFRKFKRTTNPLHLEHYKILRNKIVSDIRKSKKDYFDKLDNLLSSETTDSKLFWKTSKQMLNIGKSNHDIPMLFMNNECAETDIQKANMLNNYFASQATSDDDNRPLPQFAPVQHNLSSISITIQDVKDVLRNLNVNKACGPDLISPRLLKEGGIILSWPLSIIFNRSLEQGYFPTCWKYGNVTPIHKKDDKSAPSNYRPITLLSSLGKVMERCVHKYLYNYIIENAILTPFQSGFVRGDSTTNQLLQIYHTFCNAVDSGKEVRAVFCDISKAFDRVWHRGLLHKLSGIGCSDKITSWFSSYLTGRKQRVVLSGHVSEWMSVLAGVPQGSILGPLLFLIYINDIVKNLGCSIRFFAGDTSLYIVVESPKGAAHSLNIDLNIINTWAEAWLVAFNAGKTLSMIFSRKTNPPQHPPLLMNNIILTETDTHKHLGLTLSNTCTWSNHIQAITTKA